MYTGLHKFLRYIAPYGEKFSKRILTHIYSIKHNEINPCHLYGQNYASYKKWYKQHKYSAYYVSQRTSNT